MGHRRMKSSFRAIDLLQPVGSRRAVPWSPPPVRGLLLQLPAVGENLRSSSDDYSLPRRYERLFLDNRGDHDPRGCAADRPGEQRLAWCTRLASAESASSAVCATAGVRVERLPGALPAPGNGQAAATARSPTRYRPKKRDPGATAGCLNASTNTVAWPCSTALAHLISDMPT